MPSTAPVALVALLLAAPCAGVAKNPITKVVELVTELKAKVVADGKAEENDYNKMACWCETTTENKAKEIKEGQEQLADLANKMNANKGAIATAAADINDAMTDITAIEAYKYKETTKRERQNADFMQNKAELMNAVGALDKAVQMLGGVDPLALIQGKGKASLQESQRVAVIAAHAAVTKALQALPDDVPAPVDQLAALERVATTANGKYTPFEPSVSGILKDLLESFRATAETEANNEAMLQSSYEDLMATKADQLLSKQTMMKEKEALKASEGEQLTANELSWQTTADAVTAANDLFAAAKDACSKKAEEQKARVAAREEELDGINKCLETLTSDETRALINKAANDGPGTLDFLQVGSEDNAAGVSRAYAVLNKVAKETKSLRLSKLAAEVARRRDDGDKQHADWKANVIKSINEMLDDLSTEQSEDNTVYDLCKEEEHKLHMEIDNRTHIIGRHTIKLEQLNSKVEDLQKSIEEAAAEVEDIVKMQDELTATRDAENKEFEQEKDDDEASVKVLDTAIKQLSKFYDKQKAKKAAAMLQGEGAGVSFLQEAHHHRHHHGHKRLRRGHPATHTAVHQKKENWKTVKFAKEDPAFEVSNDDMLKKMGDHKFAKEDSRSNAAGGIVDLMNIIKEDLESDIAKSVKLEAEAKAEYDTIMGDSTKEKTDLKDKIDDYKDDKATTEEKISDTEGLKKDQEDELASANTELGNLMGKGDAGKGISFPCEFMIGHYHGRRQRRDAEVEGLKEGIAYLSGMGR